MEQVYFFSLVNFVIYASGEKGQQERLLYPLMNSLPNSETTSDAFFSSQFQSQTPYFTSNNYNEIPVKLSPYHNGKLVSNLLTTPMPILQSTTTDYKAKILQQTNENSRQINRLPSLPINYNKTKLTNNHDSEGKETRTDLLLINYRQPIDRMDAKISTSAEPFNFLTTNQNSVPKKIIISTDNGKNGEFEQKASFHNINFASSPNFLHSTTEPNIPILRLSNEMDLDGSFSYEALGADQTHYVQHSRMENLGTDKESQIVEGSYSYVGDNGQTYTVHYIADSNGYRATGDHLPVPPPIPEIIQRSIQYNLAEEAKQQPHFKYFNERVSDNNPEISKKNIENYLTIQPNLFTGRTPEAFSLGFLPGASSSQNNITSAVNFKDSLKTNYEFSTDNIKRNINYETLEPQITFRASQGAYSPLKMVKKSTLPQLVNYEPHIKETENAKNLWRWQYGLNSNTDKPNTSKQSISRSFNEGDDIIINFNEMTPEEYAKIIKNYEQIKSNLNYDFENKHETKNYSGYNDQSKKYYANSQNDDKLDISDISDVMHTNVIIDNKTLNDNHYIYRSPIMSERKLEEIIDENSNNSVSISSQVSPHWFDYKNTSYESTKTIFSPVDTTYTNTYLSNNYFKTTPTTPAGDTQNNYKFNELNRSTDNTMFYDSIVQHHEKNNFKPVNKIFINEILTSKTAEDVTTAESTIQEEIKNNVFLKHLLAAKKQDSGNLHFKETQNTKKYLETISKTPTKISLDYDYKSRNENSPVINKAFDISDILKLIDNKNIFESNKLLIKGKPLSINNLSNQKYGFNIGSSYEFISKDSKEQPNLHIYDTKHQPQQQEIQGHLKNYKVLQRTTNVRNFNSEEKNSQQNFHNKSIYSLKLPPLGRVGPSMKAYQPPIYL